MGMTSTFNRQNLSEFDLIKQYFSPLGSSHDAITALGIGDDAAVLTPPVGQQLVISTDTLIAGRHFPLNTDAFSIGWKAIAVNLSDLAAMGAVPHSLLLALTLPQADADFLAELTRGMAAACQSYGVHLIGGDTTAGPTLTLTVTALGWVPTGQAVRRSGAQIGDWIGVTDTLGDAAYALCYPQSGLQLRLDQPRPCIAFGQSARPWVHAMLDISDGFLQDLMHILTASWCSAQLELDHIPLLPQLKSLPKAERYALALTGGDDYQLCFTANPEHWQALENAATEAGQTITRVGSIISKQVEAFCLYEEGKRVDLADLLNPTQANFDEKPSLGFQHFK